MNDQYAKFMMSLEEAISIVGIVDDLPRNFIKKNAKKCVDQWIGPEISDLYQTSTEHPDYSRNEL